MDPRYARVIPLWQQTLSSKGLRHQCFTRALAHIMLDFMAWNSLSADLRVLAETRPSGVLEVLEVAALGVGGAAARRERFLQGKAKARKLPTSVLADLCKAL